MPDASSCKSYCISAVRPERHFENPYLFSWSWVRRVRLYILLSDLDGVDSDSLSAIDKMLLIVERIQNSVIVFILGHESLLGRKANEPSISILSHDPDQNRPADCFHMPTRPDARMTDR